MKIEATLSIHCSKARVARQLEQVMTPDNVGVPREQRFSMTGNRQLLVFEVDSETPASSFSTLFSILKDVSLFQEIWLLSQGKDAAVGRQP